MCFQVVSTSGAMVIVAMVTHALVFGLGGWCGRLRYFKFVQATGLLF